MATTHDSMDGFMSEGTTVRTKSDKKAEALVASRDAERLSFARLKVRSMDSLGKTVILTREVSQLGAYCPY